MGVKEHIEKAQKAMVKELAVLSLSTPCFGLLWEDENGVCPESACQLRNDCRTVFESVALEESLGSTSPKPATHERNGYVSLGRSVDTFVRQFVHTLKYPPELPSNWSYRTMRAKQYDIGKFCIVKTASYHAVFVEHAMVCRFWTNAASYGMLDIVLELVPDYKIMGFDIGKIPEKSLTKSRPCEYRTYVTSEEDATLMAEQLRITYKLDAK